FANKILQHVWKATKERQMLTDHKKRANRLCVYSQQCWSWTRCILSMWPWGTLVLISAAGRVDPQHAEELVEWITKPSSSSSSSVTQAQSSLPANVAAKAAYSIGSMSSECPELIDYSVGYMLQEDAQHFEGSNDGTKVEEGSNMSQERGGAQEGQETGSHVPPAAAYCQVCSSDEEGGDNEVTDS
ncbi:hypothetical protein AB205_0066950, partial [Aquarana catesbeiana]